MASAYTAPARFFALPDGSQSSVQVDPATGGPVAVQTAEQFQHWSMIQDARPLTATEYETKLNAAAGRPLFSDAAETDATVGGSMLDGLRAHAAMEAGTSVVTEVTPAPAGPAEYEQRANAAAQLAASLGLELVHVRDDDVMKVPGHLEVRQAGNAYAAGDLPAIERLLSGMARERAGRDRKLAEFAAYRARMAAEQAERIAALPENRLRRLEAALAAQGITVDA